MRVETEDLNNHAFDVQGIVINPPWLTSTQTTRGNISFEDISKNLKIPTKVMKDGLLFIWVEKEFISRVVDLLEAQDFYYVENMCFIMLDQNKREEVDKRREIDIQDAFVREGGGRPRADENGDEQEQGETDTRTRARTHATSPGTMIRVDPGTLVAEVERGKHQGQGVSTGT